MNTTQGTVWAWFNNDLSNSGLRKLSALGGQHVIAPSTLRAALSPVSPAQSSQRRAAGCAPLTGLPTRHAFFRSICTAAHLVQKNVAHEDPHHDLFPDLPAGMEHLAHPARHTVRRALERLDTRGYNDPSRGGCKRRLHTAARGSPRFPPSALRLLCQRTVPPSEAPGRMERCAQQGCALHDGLQDMLRPKLRRCRSETVGR